MATVKALTSSETYEWYTPLHVVAAATQTFQDKIMLDPATSFTANTMVVRAEKFFTREDNGLAQRWFGRVWLNPPYGKVNGKSNQDIWSQRMILAYEQGEIDEGLLLVNAQTSEKWFQPLFAYPICFTGKRLRFLHHETLLPKKSPTHGNAIIYFGKNPDLFFHSFRQVGNIAPSFIRQEP